MKPTVQIFNWKGMPCLQLSSGGYTAWIAPEIGSNVIRLHHAEKGIEFFRFREDNTPEAIRQSAEVWGLPTLYLGCGVSAACQRSRSISQPHSRLPAQADASCDGTLCR